MTVHPENGPCGGGHPWGTGVCPSFPGMDALLFRAGPGEGGRPELQFAIGVTTSADVLSWQPGTDEGELADVLEALRDLLRCADPFRPPGSDGSLPCGRLSDEVTLVLQRLPGDALLGAALRGTAPAARAAARTTGGRPPELQGGPPLAEAAERLRGLPRDSRRLVQALAVLGGRVSYARVGTVLPHSDDLATALQPALDAGLVSWDARTGTAGVEDRLRPVVRAGMSPAERHAAHAWAQHWSAGADRLLHRAAAARSPLPALADELEKEAYVLGQGGHAAQAARLLRHAADLSLDAGRITQRQLASVEFRLRAHHTMAARNELGSVRRHPPSPRHLLLSGRLHALEGDLRKALAELTEAHEHLTAGDRQTGPEGPDHEVPGPEESGANVSGAEVPGPEGTAGRGRSAAERGSAEEKAAAILWLAQARWLAGYPSARIRPLLKDYASAPSEDPYWTSLYEWLETVVTAREEGATAALRTIASPTTEPGIPTGRRPAPVRRRMLLTEAWLRLEAGELERCERAVHAVLDLEFVTPDTAPTGIPDILLGHLSWLRGDWTLARLYARMATRSATGLWQPLAGPLDDLIAAARGRTVPDDERGSGASPPPTLSGWAARFARLVAAVESGDAQRARRLLAVPPCPGELPVPFAPLPTWRELEVLKAASLAEDEALLDRALASLTILRERGGTAWDRMFASWGEGLAAVYAGEREAALDRFGEAESQAARIPGPLLWYRARLQADHAGLLASTGKRREALDRYRAAHETASLLEARPLLDRCAEGLAGLRLPRSARGYRLTQRESDVARLVASGLTNKETAARLYITPAAIAFHLSNIYAKAGVHNRYELRAWWQSLEDTD
ncbi:LuxR C-terminal-related transcriptional regulator [Streptomyces sp. NPDC047108]|uniref:helix-turn-helix transcriptional regulator n=1 Tax=Streptomyces sp. NPDC047108 TaxID=3155025 RepID=UPI0033F65B56